MGRDEDERSDGVRGRERTEEGSPSNAMNVDRVPSARIQVRGTSPPLALWLVRGWKLQEKERRTGMVSSTLSFLSSF